MRLVRVIEEERHTPFDNVTMLMFGPTILLMGVCTGAMMVDPNGKKWKLDNDTMSLNLIGCI